MLEMTNLMEGSSDDLVRQYLGQLCCADVHGLYQRYLPDFVLFKMVDMMGWGDGGRGCGHSV